MKKHGSVSPTPDLARRLPRSEAPSLAAPLGRAHNGADVGNPLPGPRDELLPPPLTRQGGMARGRRPSWSVPPGPTSSSLMPRAPEVMVSTGSNVQGSRPRAESEDDMPAIPTSLVRQTNLPASLPQDTPAVASTASGSTTAVAEHPNAAVSHETLIDALSVATVGTTNEGQMLQVVEHLRRLSGTPATTVYRAVVGAVMRSANDADKLVQELSALTQGQNALTAHRPRSLDDSDDEGIEGELMNQGSTTLQRPLALVGTVHAAVARLNSYPVPLSDDLRASTLRHLTDLQSMPVTAVDAGALRAAHAADSNSDTLLSLLLQLR